MPSLGSSLCNKGDGATTMILSITGEHASVEAKVNGVVVSMPCILRANDAVVLTATPDTHYRMQLDSWSGLPASATFSADYKTASFVAQDRVVGFCAPFHYEAVVSGTVSHCGVASFGVYTINTSVTLTATPDAHYHMEEESWAGLPSTTVYSADFTTATFTITDDVALTASALIDKYTVITVSNHGTCTGAGEYEYNTDATVRAFPDEHYHWQKWTVNGVEVSTDNPYTFTVTEDVTITAVLPIDQHVISCSIINGTATGAGTYDYGSQVVLSVTANEHYHWQKWDDGITGNPRTITVLEDKFYSATCPIDTHEVVVNAIAGSATGGGTYEYGEWCRVFDTAAEHYHFVNWKKDGAIISTTNPYEFQVLEDTTLDALNEIDEFTITTTIDHGTCTGAGTYEYGQTCTLLITPEAHYHFDKWDDGSLDNPRAFIVTQDLALTSSCEIDTHTVNATGVHGTVVGGGTFNYGQTCTLVVTPESSQYAFATWSDGNTDNPRLLLVDKDYELVATCAFGTMVISATAFNGTTTGSGSYEAGDTCVLTVAPVEHYHFESWDDGNTDNPRSFVVSESKTFTANCEIDEVVVTATATDGSISGDGTFHYNDPVSLACIPNEHYHFVKWNDDNTDNPRAFTATEDVTYSTACAIDTFNLVAYGIHGTVSPASGTYDYGSSVILTVTPDTHYKFVAWEDGNTDNPRTITITKDEEFTAHCTKDEVTISTTGTHATVTGAGTYRIGATVTLHAVPEAHYHMTEASWVGITGATFSSDYTSCTFTADLTRVIDVTAVIDQFTITTIGTDCTITGAGTYDYGTAVNLEVTPSAHYHFVQWTDGDTTNPRAITVTDDATYVCHAVIDEHIITSAAINATVKGTGTYKYGTSVILTVVPSDHYHFESWDDGDLNNPRTITVTENHSYDVTAVIDEHTITINASNGTATGAGTYNYGTAVNLEFTADEHYHFTKWDDGSTTNPRVINATKDMEYGVHGVIDEHIINATATHATVSGAGTYDYGTEITLAAVASEHYHFTAASWAGVPAGAVFSSDYSSCTFSVDQERNVIVTAVEDTKYTLTFNAQAHGSVSPTTYTNYPGETVSVTATADADYKFTGWADGCNLNPRTFTVGNADATYTANFAVITYELTFIADGHGTVTATVDGTAITSPAQVVPGTEVVLTDTPADGWRFREWNDGITTNPRTFTMPNYDTEIVGVNEEAVLSFNSDEFGAVTATVDGVAVLSPCRVLAGATVVLTDTASSGYKFKQWSDGVTDNPRTYTMTTTNASFHAVNELADTNYLTFEGNASTFTTLSITQAFNLEISDDASTWVSWDGLSHSVTNGKVYVRGKNGSQQMYNFMGSFTKVSGNIMSLLDYENIETVSLSSSQFYGGYGLFQNKTTLVDASGLTLPATTLTYRCYRHMFEGCTSLTSAPALPATTLAEECYLQMFYGCTNLASAPALTAEALCKSCYHAMFYNCRSIASAPTLSATTLADNCYDLMLYGCSSITSVPSDYLPLTSLYNNCYAAMFEGCTSLTSAPSLPATSLQANCYSRMFEGCTSLTSAPSLPATTLASSCYSYMFKNCTSLTSAPALPATTIAEYCYEGMFSGCTSLTSAPALPATTLGGYCYSLMFFGCTSLTSAPALPATTLAEHCYRIMFYDCTSLTGPVRIAATSPYYTGTTTACSQMFTNAGTAEGSGGTICVGGNASLWNSTNCGITTPHTTKNWDVSLMITNYITLEGDPSTFTAFKFTAGDNIYTSTNGDTWTSLSAGTSKSVTNGKIYVAGKTGSTSLYGFQGSFTKVSGNVMALVDYNNIDTVALTSRQFTSYNNVQGLFVNVGTLIDASGLELPRTTLNTRCYNRMFAGCSALKSAPALPATTLANYCYAGMFLSCTSLTSAPALPATSLANGCYSGIFSGCTSLTGPVYIYATSPFYDGSTTACSGMFTNSGISRPSTPTDYNKIKVGGNVSLWNSANADINSIYWTVQLIS